jgi:PAS domain S-box-containing protein
MMKDELCAAAGATFQSVTRKRSSLEGGLMEGAPILTIAIALQLAAAVAALRLIPVSGRRLAWVLISVALVLMALRRYISLHETLSNRSPILIEFSAEWVTLLTSALMLYGIVRIGPYLRTMNRSAQVLRESEEKYRTLFEDSRDVIFVSSRQGRILDINAAGLDLFGYTREEMMGMDARLLYATPDGRAAFQERIEREGSVKDYELKFVKRDGSKIDCLLTATLQVDQDGGVQGYRGIVRDVSEHRKMEERYRSFVENAIEGIFQTTPDGKFLMANPALARVLGYDSPRELMSAVSDLEKQLYVDPERRREFKRTIDLKGEVHNFEAGMYRKDGSSCWITINARAVRDRDGSLLYYEGTDEDITERKQAEEDHARLVAAIEQAGEGVIILDAALSVVFINPAFELMSGCSRQELLGRPVAAFRNNEGHRLFHQGLRTCLGTGEVWMGQYEAPRKDGASCEVRASISPVRNHSGDIISYVILERDVTHEAKTEKQLRQAQKLEAIGTLAGGIAHDFNNILSAMLGFTELAMMRLRGEPGVQDFLDGVLRAGQRAKELVKQILAFSRQTEQERHPVQVGPIIKEAVMMLRASLPSTIEMSTSIESHGMVMADPTQMHQVLMNLCTNAAHAMRETGGKLEVKLEDVDLEGYLLTRCNDMQPGSYLKLTVSDTGHGMTSQVRDRIFDPYYTTKGPGEGTGLGLAVAHGIVKSHGGAITVYSEPGQGSVFQVLLPKFESKAEEKALRSLKGPIPFASGNECILFVDDEETLCKTGEKILQHLGYQVAVKNSPVDALEAFRAQPGRFDLVITDMTMPKMTGVDLAREILRIRRNMPIILCTGFSEKDLNARERAIGIRELVMKPADIRSLAEAIRRALDSGGKTNDDGLSIKGERRPAPANPAS